MGITNEIKRSLSGFRDLCRNHKVSTMYAFGSSVTNNFDPESSDIDLVVENNPDYSRVDLLQAEITSKSCTYSYFRPRNSYGYCCG